MNCFCHQNSLKNLQISLKIKQTKDKPSGVDFSDAKQNLKKEVVRII